MWNALVAMDHFGGYAKGDIITGKKEIQKVLASHEHLVCKVYLPEAAKDVPDADPSVTLA